MLAFFRCVGQAVLAKGLRGLLGELPFGDFFCDIAVDAWERWRGHHREAELRAELQQVAQQGDPNQVRQLADQVSQELAPELPASSRQALSIYLSLLPSAVRQSFKQPDDPTGTTVPPALPLARPEDLMLLLPAQPPRFQPGQRPAALAGWELVDLLGMGGFGEVWLARNVSFPDLRAAFKFCLDAAAREHFLKHEGQQIQRAMKAQAGLKFAGDLDGIVHLRDANLTTDPPWLRYDYIEGSDLAGLLRTWSGLTPPQRAKQATTLIRRLAAVVGQFHRLPEKLVHRDLKPANVLVHRGHDGKFGLRVCDFGISQVAARQAIELSRRSTPRGNLAPTLRGAHTPLYASPQQKLMKDADVRDDVFALGVMWYQFMLGDLTLERPAGKWRKRIASLEVTDGLLDLLEACVDDDQAERPADALVLAEQLANLAAPKSATPLPPVALPVPVPPSAPKTVTTPVAPPAKPAPPPVVPPAKRRPGEVFTLSIPIPEPTQQPGQVFILKIPVDD